MRGDAGGVDDAGEERPFDMCRDVRIGGEPDPAAMANLTYEARPQLEPEEAATFALALRALNAAGLPYLVGAAFARQAYTGIWRKTKDLDLFVLPADLEAVLRVLAAAGFAVEITSRRWLAKARRGPHLIDLIFGTGHGQIDVQREWFARGLTVEILGVPARLMAVEEMIALAAYIVVRNRFDGSEVVHLIRGVRGRVDWERVLALLGDNRELLLWHLILFDIVYPGHAGYLPQDLMVRLFEEARRRWSDPGDPQAFRGAVLDPYSFAVDVEDWGYEDRRPPAPLVCCPEDEDGDGDGGAP